MADTPRPGLVAVGLLALGALAGPARFAPAQPQPAQPPTPTAPNPPPLPDPVPPQPPGATLPPVGGPVPAPLPVATQSMLVSPPQPRFTFTIDPKAPLSELLPPAPKGRPGVPVLTDDLAKVPEVEFQAAPAKRKDPAEAMKANAHQIAKANHLNGTKTDGFVEALRAARGDLAGLPFAMGDDCRTRGERTRQFTQAVNLVRQTMQQQGGSWNGFFERFAATCQQVDQANPAADPAAARVAALMQILAPEPASARLGLVKHLSATAHVEATKALAKLAVFAPEADVRRAAVDALKVRRERDYTDVLRAGLAHPWPAAARGAGEAIAGLERADLIPDLLDVLDAPDPRAPAAVEADGKKVTRVRELVRVNHHKSCLMCHSPGNTDGMPAEALTAPVPTPGEPLPTPFQGYQGNSPDVLVRIDVTYLRQDFSALLPVAEPGPWPEMQRFDFLVRTRELTDDEAAECRAALAPKEAGQLSPYHRAALAALRELTGKDAEPTAAAWRKLLKMPRKV